MRLATSRLALVATIFASPFGAFPALAAPDLGTAPKPDEIAGTVTSPQGPEAGVWVIAETLDLPTRFAKIVVTDDQGRYLIPQMPKAHYKVWVRGYGLVDSAKVDADPGQPLDLHATPAPSEAAAAEFYPGMYWYSMLHIPGTDLFPGTGDGEGGNGIPNFMKTQAAWIDTVKNSCQSCHALGSLNIRHPKPELGQFDNSTDLWARRITSGQAMTGMALAISRLGPIKGLSLYADWTDRIAAGALPAAHPDRPQGPERNMVVSLWDWSSPKHYMHDAISTDKRNPTVNAGGYIYGSPEESTDDVPVLDPKTHRAWTIHHPYNPGTPSSTDEPRGTSPFWGDEAIWDGHTSNHNLILDDKARLWFAARSRAADDPAWCKRGSDFEPARVAPLETSVRQLSLYEPDKNQFTLIDTCFTTQHLYFGHDADNTLWTSYGPPSGPVIGWLDTKKFLETRDARASQGWSPMIVDVPGWGHRGDYAEINQPIDPTKQKRVLAGLYGVQSSPIDDTIWGQSMDIGFSRMDQPSYLVHFIPGPDPVHTGLTEIFKAPAGAYGMRGTDVDTKGVVWTAMSSGHLASFDRSKCRDKIMGPAAATGDVCPEGWTLYRFPGPQFAGVDPNGSANHAYYVWVDRYDTFGLGNDIPMAMTNGGEAITALVDGKMLQFHVPYPTGFFTKNVDGRIDNPAAGWKGRGLWTTSGTRTMFHNEGGTTQSPRVYHIQYRPNPLAD